MENHDGVCCSVDDQPTGGRGVVVLQWVMLACLWLENRIPANRLVKQHSMCSPYAPRSGMGKLSHVRMNGPWYGARGGHGWCQERWWMKEMGKGNEVLLTNWTHMIITVVPILAKKVNPPPQVSWRLEPAQCLAMPYMPWDGGGVMEACELFVGPKCGQERVTNSREPPVLCGHGMNIIS